MNSKLPTKAFLLAAICIIFVSRTSANAANYYATSSDDKGTADFAQTSQNNTEKSKSFTKYDVNNNGSSRSLIDPINQSKNGTSSTQNPKEKENIVYINESEIGNIVPMRTAGILNDVYVMDKKPDWSNGEFPIFNSTGGIAFTVTNKINGSQLEDTQFAIIGADRWLRLTTDANSGTCGFSQEYSSSDHVFYSLRPRFFLPDRWYLSGDLISPLKDHAYEFQRESLSLEGDIITLGTHTRHAKLTNTKLVYDWVKTQIPSGQTLAIYTDGSIPLPNLIALIIIAQRRIQKCGY